MDSFLYVCEFLTDNVIFDYCVYLGNQGPLKEMADITNKRLGDGLEAFLPPFYTKHDIFFVRGNYVGPPGVSLQHNNLSINWCLGDKDIEVLDSNMGYVTDG